MEILVKRIYNCSRYCISHIYINGEYVCDGIEDTDRMLDDSMTEQYIRSKKISCETAIPTGVYKMTINIISPKFSKKKYYMDFCGGKLPRLKNVKGFDGILWHRGNTEKDSAGCLILGYNKVKGKVINSQEAFEKVYNMLKSINKATNEEIIVKYIRTYDK